MIRSNSTFKEQEEKELTEKELNELYEDLVESEEEPELKIELNPKKEKDDDLLYTLLGIGLAVGIVLIAIWQTQ